MQSKQQFCNSLFRIISRAATVALAMATVFALAVVLTQSAQAQTFKVLHTFTGGADGASPLGSFTMDQAGNIYGAPSGGGRGNGTVFRLWKKGSNWLFNPLYAFLGSDGSTPWSAAIMGSDGNLYGATFGGGPSDAGVVYSLKKPAGACETALCPWTETVLYSFTGGNDGAGPGYGHFIFDQAGNMFGETLWGGAYGAGTVFELVPSQGGWMERVLHSFNGNDGYLPATGLVFDNVGNLYGTTLLGGVYGQGTVFQLTPSGSGWTENVLYSFQGGSDGAHPYPGVIFDPSGNLYGGTAAGGQGNGGTAFKLTPSGGAWTYELIYSFTGGGGNCGGGGDCGPVGNFIMDGAGNIYSFTNYEGAYNEGTVFELTPSGGSWTYTSLYNFTGGSDGAHPTGGPIFDENGNLYGATLSGGAYGGGVVWEITFP
jgi:uncharacterized repeat protein (TIGR03803 family)